MAAEIQDNLDRITLSALLYRRGPAWVAQQSAKLLADHSAEPGLSPRDSHEFAYAARAYHEASECILEREYREEQCSVSSR